jgi:Family of unknown function (DUF6152)
MLRRLGWNRDSLKIGDQVTVEGYAARDGSKRVNARRLILADGKKVLPQAAHPQTALSKALRTNLFLWRMAFSCREVGIRKLNVLASDEFLNRSMVNGESSKEPISLATK